MFALKGRTVDAHIPNIIWEVKKIGEFLRCRLVTYIEVEIDLNKFYSSNLLSKEVVDGLHGK